MNPVIDTSLGHVDPAATPLDINELIDLLNPRLSSVMQGSYIPYVIQHDTPGVPDRDKAWIELDTQGRPIAAKTWWHGSWRRIYNGMLGEVRMFSGDPTNDQLWNAVGRGQPGEIYDGWQICNGNNGSPDLSDRFIVGAHMRPTGSGYDPAKGGWVSNISNSEGEHTGGVKEITLNGDNTYQPIADIGHVKVGKYTVAGSTLDPSGILWGKISDADETKNTTLQIQSDGNTDPDAIPTVPPFIALGFIVFIGYAT
jgi:hypothetical protein